jgi:hypothetical protein
MIKNVGSVDRIARILLGMTLIGLVATSQIGSWGYLGVMTIATGLFSFCGLYTLLGLNTCSIKK